ncbi:hypothetical protein JP0252_13170 [Helicobacter pylori]
MRSASYSIGLNKFNHKEVYNNEIKFSGINDSSEFVSCGRFVQFADKQGSDYPLHKLTKKEIK